MPILKTLLKTIQQNKNGVKKDNEVQDPEIRELLDKLPQEIENRVSKSIKDAIENELAKKTADVINKEIQKEDEDTSNTLGLSLFMILFAVSSIIAFESWVAFTDNYVNSAGFGWQMFYLISSFITGITSTVYVAWLLLIVFHILIEKELQPKYENILKGIKSLIDKSNLLVIMVMTIMLIGWLFIRSNNNGLLFNTYGLMLCALFNIMIPEHIKSIRQAGRAWRYNYLAMLVGITSIIIGIASLVGGIINKTENKLCDICNEPAMYAVVDKEHQDELYYCKKHLDIILREDEEQDGEELELDTEDSGKSTTIETEKAQDNEITDASIATSGLNNEKNEIDEGLDIEESTESTEESGYTTQQ